MAASRGSHDRRETHNGHIEVIVFGLGKYMGRGFGNVLEDDTCGTIKVKKIKRIGSITCT